MESRPVTLANTPLEQTPGASLTGAAQRPLCVPSRNLGGASELVREGL